MKSTNFEQQLVLYLIKYTNCNSSYLLVKILSWKFKIINSIDVFNDLLKKGLIKKYSKDQIDYYDLTKTGDNQIIEGLESFREDLIINISNHDKEYVEILLSRSISS